MRRVSRLIDADDSVLIVVDVQPQFLDKIELIVADQLVDRVAWLVALARRLAVPVVVTEEEPEVHGATHHLVVEQLGEQHERHLKPTFGAAGAPHIMQAIRATERVTAVLVGLETDVCVAQTALGLLDEGMRVVVVSDSVASPGESYDQGLQRMCDSGAVMVGTKGLAYEWVRSVDRIALLPDRAAPSGIVL